MKSYVNFELDIVLIENTDIVTSSPSNPFEGVGDGFEDPNNNVDAVGDF